MRCSSLRSFEIPDPMPAPTKLGVVTASSTSAPAPIASRVDEELMTAAAAGSKAAFAVLVERYMQRVVSYCAKVAGDRPSGEELAQDTFLQIWARRASYRPERPFAVFLFTAATNRCRNHRRGWRRRLRWQVDDAADIDRSSTAALDADQLDALIAQERQRRVHQAAGLLPAKQREAVLLRFDQGLSYPEIAIIVGRPEATVRTRIFHGLKKLRESLGEERP